MILIFGILSVLADTCPKLGRVFVLPDVHGDLPSLVSILEKAELVKKQRWIAKDDVWLVATGDFADRDKLVLLAGNHELMNLGGNYRYVSPREMERHGLHVWQAVFSRFGEIGLFIRESFGAIAQIGNVVFVHAGLSSLYEKESIKSLNENYRKLIVEQDFFSDFLSGPRSLFWFRDNAMGLDCSSLEDILETFNATTMVVGHTVTESRRIEKKCDGQLILNDVGMSLGMDGEKRFPSILELVFSSSSHCAVEKLKPMFPESKLVSSMEIRIKRKTDVVLRDEL